MKECQPLMWAPAQNNLFTFDLPHPYLPHTKTDWNGPPVMDQKAIRHTTWPGLRVGGGRPERYKEKEPCVWLEAWDSEWQENTETVGRAVGRSQLSLCVCLSGHSSTRPRHRGDGLNSLGFTCVQARHLLVGHPSLLKPSFVPLRFKVKSLQPWS